MEKTLQFSELAKIFNFANFSQCEVVSDSFGYLFLTLGKVGITDYNFTVALEFLELKN